jgi:hypothetical protein
MNGLVAAVGYPFMKGDHPGTMTILLVDIIIRVWALVAGRSDVVDFGLKHYDAIIDAARTAEAVAPFVNAAALHFETVLIPESLMVSCAILGMAFAVKAALDSDPPDEAAPSCANVSSMFVRAPENELNRGGEMAFGTQDIKDRFSDAYARVFKTPLLNHQASNLLYKNFLPYSYAKLATEYPCIVVRSYWKLDGQSSKELFDLNPEHCSVDNVEIYAIGIACEKIKQSFQSK